ncbi:uncharacterized protein LOC133163398 [Syngnathus typhle]|uniref:uncharacterized protein LOC133163398 n=1 Tax=Syngnathus typhle TaxID=161592 RepID=UPI002A6AF4A6|nr:uncharacterized protein LOC133163398 [Syngnathus typhle]XP_061149243.1 uncharacterized protein LOC133163398 [Syngnathus typhle]
MMPLVTRLLFVFVPVCAAVAELSLSPRSAQASSVGVLRADVVKTYSQSSQPHDANNVLPYKPFQSEITRPTDRLFVRQGENLYRYPVVVLKSAPGHPLHPRSRNRKEDLRRGEEVPSGDAPKTSARRGAPSEGQSVWQRLSHPPRYLTASRKEPTEADVPKMPDGIRPGRFPLRPVTASVEKTPRSSVFKHSNWREESKKEESSAFKPSFVAREDFGKPLRSPAASKFEKDKSIPLYSWTMSGKDDAGRNAGGRYPVPSRIYLPGPFAAQRHKDAPSGSAAMTTRKPLLSFKQLVTGRSRWPASEVAGDSATNKGRSFKAVNIYPSLLSKYTFNRRRVEPTAAPSATGFPYPQNLDRGQLKQPSNQVKGQARPSEKSAAQQIFQGLNQNYTSPVANWPLRYRNQQNQTAGGGGPKGTERRLAEGKSRLFGTSTSSTARGRRVNTAHHAGPKRVAANWPIVRLPKGDAITTPAPTSAPTEPGVGFSSSEVPAPTGADKSRTTTLNGDNVKTDRESNRSDAFDDGTNETLQEDLLELNYLRIATGNISFKSI